MEQTAQHNSKVGWWRHWMLPLLLLVFSISISLMGDAATQILRFERDGVFAGQWWRLVSGHLAHLGWSHLWLNLAGLLLVWLLVGRALPLRQWSGVVMFNMVGISFGLLVWLPQLQWYVGLSGLLHGMLLAGGLRQALRGDREAMVIIVIVLAKVAWELWQGPLPGSREAAGGEVVFQAHALGCLCGAIYVAALTVILRTRAISA